MVSPSSSAPPPRTTPNCTGRWYAERLEGGVATLAYEGEIAATHVGTKNEGKEGQRCSSEARMLGGVGTCDVASGRLLSLTLVLRRRIPQLRPVRRARPLRGGSRVVRRAAGGGAVNKS